MNILHKLLKRFKHMMSCEEANRFLTDYFEDALDPATRHAFESHMAMCTNCHTYLEQYRLTVELVRTLPPPPVPPELAQEVIAFLNTRRGDSASE